MHELEGGRTYVLPFNLTSVNILSVLSSLDKHDHTSYIHSENTAVLALHVFDLYLQFSDEKSPTDVENLRQRLYWNALLHDVGKLFIEDTILQKPGRLTDEERHKMRKHDVLGYLFLTQNSENEIRKYFLPVKYHHAWWKDLDQISEFTEEDKLIISFLSVIDALEAITAKRPYDNTHRTVNDAIEMMRKDEGRYDPKILEFIEDNSESIQEVISNLREEDNLKVF